MGWDRPYRREDVAHLVAQAIDDHTRRDVDSIFNTADMEGATTVRVYTDDGADFELVVKWGEERRYPNLLARIWKAIVDPW